MPRFSLITATKGRTDEVARLIASCESQDFEDYQLVLIDQNEDERLVPIIHESDRKGKTLRITSPVGISVARNRGLAYASGQILAFPDDDCCYPPQTLSRVSQWFDTYPALDILSLASRSDSGQPSGNRWFRKSCNLSTLNIFRTSVSYCLFMRVNEKSKALRFDENLGLGTQTSFISGEDTDFVLAAMQRGLRGRYESCWHIIHPLKDVRSLTIPLDRFCGYGRGMGHVQRKYNLIWLCLGFSSYNLIRSATMLLLGRKRQAALWYAHAKGLLSAYFHNKIV